MSDLDDALAAARGGRVLAPALEADLQLAVACALHHGPALAAFDVLLREEVARAVRAVDPSGVDELTQRVRERLLVAGPDGRRRIADYRAEAPLRAWIRAVALRTALNERRASGRELPTSQPPDQGTSNADPELALMRARHRDVFRAAFAAAIAQLTPRDRTVLRLHTLDGVTLARIGAMYQKDTSTVSRWLEQIRKSLLASTRAHLAERLQMPSGELDSVLRAADSEMSVSLSRLLADDP